MFQKLIKKSVFFRCENMVLQMGGQTVLVEPTSGNMPPKDFDDSVIVRYFNVRFSRKAGVQPDAAEQYAKALIQIVKDHVPPNFRKDSKVGLVMTSDELEKAIGFDLQSIKKLKPHVIVEQMDKMSQSERSPLAVTVPKVCFFLW